MLAPVTLATEYTCFVKKMPTGTHARMRLGRSANDLGKTSARTHTASLAALFCRKRWNALLALAITT